jgi:signal transduction histidine kinase
MTARQQAPEPQGAKPRSRWHRCRHAVGHSIKLRLVLVFLLLGLAMTATFIGGAKKAFSSGWRDAARPLLMDYVDHLATEITAGGHPDIARAQALAQRLPVTIEIHGPQVNWQSHPNRATDWRRLPAGPQTPGPSAEDGGPWLQLLSRTTADGHRLDFGIDDGVFEHRPRLFGYTLGTLLLLTLLAYLYVRNLLRPLDHMSAGALRFGAGDFGQPIPVRHPGKPDELGQLAATINTMGRNIQQMLDAKRALLLAISHELRSPLTRARLNTELLPETAEIDPQRQALLRDLGEMARLITDLLESERLATSHAALQREPVALDALARDVIAELQSNNPAATPVALHAEPGLPLLPLDPARMRLLLRNLLDNARRHGAGAPQPPELHLRASGPGRRGLQIDVRDHGPGVPPDQLSQLAQAFARPDSARARAHGGVGLGLYLCKRVALAHGGTFDMRNAQPGLLVTVTLPPEENNPPSVSRPV